MKRKRPESQISLEAEARADARPVNACRTPSPRRRIIYTEFIRGSWSSVTRLVNGGGTKTLRVIQQSRAPKQLVS